MDIAKALLVRAKICGNGIVVRGGVVAYDIPPDAQQEKKDREAADKLCAAKQEK
jgi:hypothetical protein